MKYYLEDFNPSLKKEMQFFHYDVALYCDYFQKSIQKLWPTYLYNLKQKISDYSKEFKTLNKRHQLFPKEYRIYIFDNRINLLFATVETAGVIATYFSKFCAQYDKYSFEKNNYGDTSKIGTVYPCKIKGQLAAVYNKDEMQQFNKHYGFMPIEIFACPSIAIFSQGTLEEARTITIEQCTLLMEKFRSNNFVDYKTILDDIHFSDSWAVL